jgi:flavoprotein
MSCAQEVLLNVFNEFFFEPLVTEMSDMIKRLVNIFTLLVEIFKHVVFLYGLWQVLIAVFMSYYREFEERNKKLTKKVGALEYAMANRGHKPHDDGRSYTW